jgi:uncharacterized protein (DUF2147 family)
MRPLAVALLAPLLAVLALAAPARAADASAQIVGRWRTIDDATKKPKSIVQIYEENGKLFGKIEQLLDPKPDDPDPVCKKCEGDLKDQRILGLRFMWDFKKDGSGGRILDPDNGKVYKCNLTVKDGGKKLDVRGYIGISLIGRTQTWLREE